MFRMVFMPFSIGLVLKQYIVNYLMCKRHTGKQKDNFDWSEL